MNLLPIQRWKLNQIRSIAVNLNFWVIMHPLAAVLENAAAVTLYAVMKNIVMSVESSLIGIMLEIK